jgi:hypothetical protein
VSAPHVIHLIEHLQVVHQIEHSAPVQAIVGTLLTTLVGLAVAAFFKRRQIAWRAYVDAPITLDAKPGQERRRPGEAQGLRRRRS